MLKIIFIVLIVLVAIALIMAALKPNRFRVERSINIKTSPEKIFPHINNFHLWGAWSPWENLDPAMKRSFSGATEGVGAKYAWQGNSKVGEGKMEIIESSPYKILIQLDFIKPIRAHNKTEYILQANDDSTLLTWSMEGENPYIAKLMMLFFNQDKMCGDMFEKGLASLKAIAEN